MLRSNLAVLLAERNLKITKVSNDTGISRTTLTSLANNYSQGIQFETLNTLCSYLKVTPDALFFYIPIDIRLEILYDHEEQDLNVDVVVKDRSREKNFRLHGSIWAREKTVEIIAPSPSSAIATIVDISLSLPSQIYDQNIASDNQELLRYLKMVPVPFLTDFENEIVDHVHPYFEDTNDIVGCNLLWPEELDVYD